MKVSSVNRVLMAAITLAAAQYVKASPLSISEINNVRGVLRAMNVDESQLSNEVLEALRNQGQQLRNYEKSKSDFYNKSSEGEINMTCGGGSHGSGKDPV
jgi:hypothetical protein